MFVDMKPRIDEEAIRDLIGYGLFGDMDEERQEEAVRSYREMEDQYLFGIEEDGEPVGLIGFRINGEEELTISLIAVEPESRGMGYGRGLILEVIEWAKPKRVLAETDEEAVDFYRNIGFEIESLGEKYPGVERFLCSFETDAGEEP